MINNDNLKKMLEKENTIYVFEKEKEIVIKINNEILGLGYNSEIRKNVFIDKANRTIRFLKLFTDSDDFNAMVTNSRILNDEDIKKYNQACRDKTEYPIIYIK